MATAEASSTAPVFSGERKNGRMEGQGTYRFPSGTVYTGEFLDGEFHGEGTLQFEGCGKYHATWDRGKVVKGRYVFADGLAYTAPDDGSWPYCREKLHAGEDRDTGQPLVKPGDRRFYSELVEGLRPSGDSQLSNTHPPPTIPTGTYDVGDGYLAEDGKVFAYGCMGEDGRPPAGGELRVAKQHEEAWAKGRCRLQN